MNQAGDSQEWPDDGRRVTVSGQVSVRVRGTCTACFQRDAFTPKTSRVRPNTHVHILNFGMMEVRLCDRCMEELGKQLEASK